MKADGMNPITEDDIANYLANTPDFFARHAELLASVQLSSPHGNRAVSLQERQAEMLREKIKALSSEAIASASIIGVLPPGVCALILITAPDYMKVMFSDPRGNIMLAGAGFWMGMGIFTMRKMINFKF